MMNTDHRPDPAPEFNVDEVVRLKGQCFKIVLVDGYTGKIAMKWISPEEASRLEASAAAAKTASAGTLGAGRVTDVTGLRGR